MAPHYNHLVKANPNDEPQCTPKNDGTILSIKVIKVLSSFQSNKNDFVRFEQLDP